MISNFELVIGIEIHIELNTQTKCFSPISNDFNGPVNELISPIDLGYPGTLPLLNQAVVIKAIKLAKALNMEIAVSYTHLTLPTNTVTCRSRWSPYH